MNQQTLIYPAELLQPVVPCPNCGDPVKGSSGSRTVALPYHSIGGLAGACQERPPQVDLVFYTLYPCCCEVSHFWMSAMAEEMGRRKKRQPPRDVSLQAAVLLDQRKQQIDKHLLELYSRRDLAIAAGREGEKQKAERDLCVVVRELQLILPGKPTTVRSINLSKEVRQWAKQKGLAIAPSVYEAVDRAAVTIPEIVAALKQHPRHVRQSASDLTKVAETIYFELDDFVRTGRKVDQLTVDIISKIVPHADSVLIPRKSAGPVLEVSPLALYQQRMRKRRPHIDRGGGR